jgi:hypothetical protein
VVLLGDASITGEHAASVKMDEPSSSGALVSPHSVTIQTTLRHGEFGSHVTTLWLRKVREHLTSWCVETSRLIRQAVRMKRAVQLLVPNCTAQVSKPAMRLGEIMH